MHAPIFLLLLLVVAAGALKVTTRKRPAGYIATPLLTPAEREFFKALSKATPAEVHICPKVRLRDLASPKDWKNGNRINQKHVDFVLCKKPTLDVLAVVELDDSSHQRADRQKRDALVAQVLKSAGIRLINVPCRKTYAPEELKKRIDLNDL